MVNLWTDKFWALPPEPLSDDTLDSGPVQPSDDVRAELVALLETDQSRLGQVYRGVRREFGAYVIGTGHAADRQKAT